MNSPDNRDDYFLATYTLKEQLEARGFSYLIKHPNQVREPYRVVWFDIHPTLPPDSVTLINPEQQILFIWEPRTIISQSYRKDLHQYFSKVYTWDDSLLEEENQNSTYRKFYYPQLRIPRSIHYPSYADRKLVTLVNRYAFCRAPGEQKSERVTAIRFFEQYYPDDFDLYGRGWPREQFPSYRGPIHSKEDVLPNYRFLICYENTNIQQGYISEKIFDAFYNKCIPLYLGAPNIEDYIPRECFIDARNFSNYRDLSTFLENIDEESFEQYLNAASQFLHSKKAQDFSVPYFIKIALEALDIVETPHPKP